MKAQETVVTLFYLCLCVVIVGLADHFLGTELKFDDVDFWQKLSHKALYMASGAVGFGILRR